MANSMAPRILYVEDDVALARLVRHQLTQAGYEVTLAYDGAEGWARYVAQPWDVLVVDFDLPIQNGLEIVRQACAQGTAPPILMVTGASEEDVAVEALQLGVADYLVKDSKGNYLKLLPRVISHVREQRRLLEEKRLVENALLCQEERQRDLVEITGDCIWEVNGQGICTYVSPKVETLLGRKPREILGVKLLDLLDKEEARRVLRRVGASLRRREPIRNLPTTHRHKQGQLVSLETSAIPILDADGQCLGYRGIDRDITGRQQAEEALRMSEQKFRGVVDNTPMGIALVSESMELTFCNRQMRQWFPEANLTGTPRCYCALRTPPCETVCEGCPTAMTLRDGEVHEGIQEVYYGQESRHYRIISAPLRDREARVIAAINLVDDVTEQRRAEQALAESERLMRSVLHTTSSLIYAKDEAGRYLLANEAMAALYQTTPQEMLGKTDEDFVARGAITRQAAEQFGRDDARVVEEQHVVDVAEVRLEMPDGALRWFQARKSPLAVGIAARCVLGVAVDITERKRMEQNLAQAQKLEAVGQLAAGIAHEINTPIQYIGDNSRFVLEAFQGIGHLSQTLEELLEACKAGTVDQALVEKAEETLRQSDIDYYSEEVPLAILQSLDGVNRVARIVRAIKEYAHPGSEEKQAIDLNRAVESALTLARNEWKYVAEMVTAFDANLPLVHCRPGDINQVVLNLVVNAAQAIAEAVRSSPGTKGTIRVSTGREGPWAQITVEDTGRGIPAEIHSKIFNPFFTTKEIGQGSGQGLAIVHSLVVEKHGGTIRFETEVGHGTTFYVRLPIDGQAVTVRSEYLAANPLAYAKE